VSNKLPKSAVKIEELESAAGELAFLLKHALYQIKAGSPQPKITKHHDYRVRECLRIIYEYDEAAWQEFLQECSFDVV
jgi:hypothetical protein